MLSIELPGPRTPLYPLIQQRVTEAAQSIVERLQAWRMMNSGVGLTTTTILGKPVRYSSGQFEGSARLVFWRGFFEPFLVRAAQQSLQWTIDCCRERQLAPVEYLAETRDLLRLLIERVYEHMARTDQLLRGKGFPNTISPVNISPNIETMTRYIDDLVVALTHRGTPAPAPPAEAPMSPDLQPSQVDLLVDLIEAAQRILPAREDFLSSDAQGNDPRLLVHHRGFVGPYSAHPNDLVELDLVQLIHITRHPGSVWVFFIRSAGHAYYRRLKQSQGAPIERIEATLRRWLDGERFQKRHPEAYRKWALAEERLLEANAEEHLTAIGHHCREAIQEFVSGLVAQYQPPAVDPNPAHDIARFKAVLLARAPGTTLAPFLEALWRALGALVQRQEHGAQREGEPLGIEDGRRVVYQTLNVMYEVDRTLD
jgi:hypothetical protein